MENASRLLESLSAEEIRERLLDLDREQRALRVLLRDEPTRSRQADTSATTGGPAMPQVASRYLTPPQVAERFGVDPHRVLAWIRSGQLLAVNIGDGTQRPRFRVSESDLALFLAARAARPEPRVSRIRRKKDPSVIEFF